MSSGAWSRGPPAWLLSSPETQTPSLATVMDEQQNESIGKSSNSGGKTKTDRLQSEPWYPGKVNRNRTRVPESQKSAQRKRIEPPSASASASSRTPLKDNGTTSGTCIAVVNVHKKDLNKLGYKDLVEWVKEPDHLYIGRDMTLYVPGAEKSKWHNPFKSKQIGRENSCKRYKEYVMTDKTVQSNGKTLFESLGELKGKTLGCWCHPEMCHGHILRELVQEFCP